MPLGYAGRPRVLRSGFKVAIVAGAGCFVAVVAIAVIGTVWPRSAAVHPPMPPTAATPIDFPPLPVETATVQQIRVHEAADLSVIRLAENPRIVVLDFASLSRQRNMLDRVAALIEKVNLPRDRILNKGELESAVQAGGEDDAGFYYGHDYSYASLVRFFAIADRDHVVLTQEEVTLRRLLGSLGWTTPCVAAGLISVPRVGANGNVTMAARDTILPHELSHGEYFSNPAYAAYVHHFFLTVMTPPEQEAFRNFLVEEGYDPSSVELIENETQAYLLFTPDPRFFSLPEVHMTPARRAELRIAFLVGMPAGWLKDVLSGIP
jgi:hypothetical protein